MSLHVVPGAWGNQGAQGVLFDSTTNITIEALLEDHNDPEPQCSALQGASAKMQRPDQAEDAQRGFLCGPVIVWSSPKGE